jgi:hypothetical protein
MDSFVSSHDANLCRIFAQFGSCEDMMNGGACWSMSVGRSPEAYRMLDDVEDDSRTALWGALSLGGGSTLLLADSRGHVGFQMPRPVKMKRIISVLHRRSKVQYRTQVGMSVLRWGRSVRLQGMWLPLDPDPSWQCRWRRMLPEAL